MRDAGHLIIAVVRTAFAIIVLAGSVTVSLAQEPDNCERPAPLQADAFNQPMSFFSASHSGNMSTSSWISAIGEITPETPALFREFLGEERLQGRGGQMVLHSPGGNLLAGLELGRLIREAGLTVHVGQTERVYYGHDAPCERSEETVKAGTCASACAYAFLGGAVRFVDSPYYPTSESNILAFHQFFSSANHGDELLTPEQVAAVEASTISMAQALTGSIVLYAIDMGIDPRIVALASSTPSSGLYQPTPQQIEELSIASGSGLAAWFMEPYNGGLVTATTPQRSDSLLQQITAFCSRDLGEESFLITMDLVTPSYPDPDDLPLRAVVFEINGIPFIAPRHDLAVRYRGNTIVLTVRVGGIAPLITNASQIRFSLDAPRSMGNFRESSQLDETARQSIALAWRNCI